MTRPETKCWWISWGGVEKAARATRCGVVVSQGLGHQYVDVPLFSPSCGWELNLTARPLRSHNLLWIIYSEQPVQRISILILELAYFQFKSNTLKYLPKITNIRLTEFHNFNPHFHIIHFSTLRHNIVFYINFFYIYPYYFFFLSFAQFWPKIPCNMCKYLVTMQNYQIHFQLSQLIRKSSLSTGIF